MKNSVFYSWQSDLPNPTNRTFIESAIKSAIKKVGEDVDLTSAMRDGKLKLDKDTKGVSGSPPIVDVIFNKIANCAIFVPDMTFVGKSDGGRLIPNPNVLVEYGWALRTVTNLRIVPVMNSYYGKPSWKTLPFDMRHLRHPFAYELNPKPSPEEKKAAKEALVSHLVVAFKTVFESGVLDEDANDVPFGPSNMIDLIKEYIIDDRYRIKLHELINDEVERTFAAINRDDLLEFPSNYDGDEFRRRARIFEAETATIRQMIATACFWGNSGHVETWIGLVQRFDRLRRQQSGLTIYLNLQRYPAFLVFQTCAFSAFSGNQFSTLARLMSEGEYESRGLPASPSDTFDPSNTFSGGGFGELREPPEEGHKWSTPGNLQLWDVLRDSTKELIPDGDTFENVFDRFEYLHQLIVADNFLQRGNDHACASHGIFVWRKEIDGPSNVFSFFDNLAATRGGDWPLLKSGLFGGSLERFKKAKEAIDPILKRGWMSYIH